MSDPVNGQGNNQELVQIVPQVTNTNYWQPIQGDETTALLNYLTIPQSGKQGLVNASLGILAKCINPHTKGSNSTGIVIGHVQSGKTMSFTCVTTAARDNHFQLIIVITGISTNLFNQSSSRLEEDLRLKTRSDRKWLYIRNAQLSNLSSIENTLADWRDPTVPHTARKTVLITVMKNTTRLANLVQLLQKLDLKDAPALIIDDEADQAGLNTRVRQGYESTTYSRLLSIRDSLPRHSFLQYTATPQAPLLINLIDRLSPKFAELLTPGAGYTGGEIFFVNNPNLVKVIPDDEIPTDDNDIYTPPDSLVSAMQMFFLGVAAGIYEDPNKAGSGNRSMLVHPSQKTHGHQQYFRWVKKTKELWESILTSTNPGADLQDLRDAFQSSYAELNKTVSNLPPFDELMRLLPRAIRTEIREVNATTGRTPEINWKDHYSWILVGGQAMDRGFTVEGLTVTYMPRGIGVGNADNVEQRARFFGYKGSYLGYCRIFLESTARYTYTQYVHHEMDIRKRLTAFNNAHPSDSLDQWKRAFFLDKELKPTRESVLSLDYMRLREDLNEDWYWPKAPYASDQAVRDNRVLVESFAAQLNLQTANGHSARSAITKHEVDFHVPLSQVFEDLLMNFRLTTPLDSTRHTGFLIQIEKYLEDNPNETCVVYLMSKDGSNWSTRFRTIDEEDGIAPAKILFQGESDATNKYKRGEVYPGDRKIKEDNMLTVQIHRLELKKQDGSTINSDVPLIVVWVPQKMSKGWFVQGS